MKYSTFSSFTIYETNICNRYFLRDPTDMSTVSRHCRVSYKPLLIFMHQSFCMNTYKASFLIDPRLVSRSG